MKTLPSIFIVLLIAFTSSASACTGNEIKLINNTNYLLQMGKGRIIPVYHSILPNGGQRCIKPSLGKSAKISLKYTRDNGKNDYDIFYNRGHLIVPNGASLVIDHFKLLGESDLILGQGDYSIN